MGAITAEDDAHYQALGYDTSNRGEDVGRAGVELSTRPRCTASGARSSTRSTRTATSSARSAAPTPVNGKDIQLSIDLDVQQYAERLLQTQLRIQRAFTAPNPIVKKPDGTRQRMSLSHGVSACTTRRRPAPWS